MPIIKKKRAVHRIHFQSESVRYVLVIEGRITLPLKKSIINSHIQPVRSRNMFVLTICIWCFENNLSCFYLPHHPTNTIIFQYPSKYYDPLQFPETLPKAMREGTPPGGKRGLCKSWPPLKGQDNQMTSQILTCPLSIPITASSPTLPLQHWNTASLNPKVSILAPVCPGLGLPYQCT